MSETTKQVSGQRAGATAVKQAVITNTVSYTHLTLPTT